MRAFLLAGACACFALCCLGTENNDWLIVPGKRAGPITPTATRVNIVKLFGARNVEEDEIQTSDFGTEEGTKVFWGTPDSSLAILWLSDAGNSRIRRIRFCPNLVQTAKCRWHTAEGIALGTRLRDLERLNGRGFSLNGFDWGFGGLVTSWNGGRLENLAINCGGLMLRLDPPPGPGSDERARLMEVVEDNEEFASSHAAMQALNPVVDFMSLSFQNCR